jgi:hypothetical protein
MTTPVPLPLSLGRGQELEDAVAKRGFAVCRLWWLRQGAVVAILHGIS